MSTKTNLADNGGFYPTHSKQRVTRIKNLKKLLGKSGQPDFIQSMSVDQGQIIQSEGETSIDTLPDGQSEVVQVLGEEPIDLNKLSNKFMRIDRMVIPKNACMVNPDVLAEIVQDTTNKKSVDISTPGLFYNGKLEDGVLLNVCGMVETVYYTDMHFHPCENKITPLNFHHSDDGFRTCPTPQLIPTTSDNNLAKGAAGIRHKLVVFHMPQSELLKPQGSYISPRTGKEKPNYTIKQILKMYFKDNKLKEKAFTPKIHWKHKNVLKGGIFLIPMVMPDDRVAYYGVLNVDGESNRRTPVKQILKNWFAAVNKYNEDPEGQWIGIAGNDATLCFIDDWSIFIGKNAQLLVANKADVYKQAVLDSAIR